MASWAARALVNFPETVNYFPAGRAEVTGVPVRQEFFAIGNRPRSERFHVLISGGSQGSRTLNNAGRESWRLFSESRLPVCFLHQAGRGNAERLSLEFRASGLEGEVVDFISDMPAAFAKADLIICRAGASTVSELAAAGRASVLVPFPFAADNHQQRNAEAMERAGAAELIVDSEMTGQTLFETVAKLIADPDRLQEMGRNARKLARPGAAVRAADVLEEVSA
jgi:UDP-N-acetylglucosamine--N-acetylmuramyl-(pentapeptide) pyrophosphoryl-undecaprenol N-acetylglucosamine transferase